MSPFLQACQSCIQHLSFRHSVTRCALLIALTAGGCGDVICPEPLSNVDGLCVALGPDAHAPDAFEKPEQDAGVKTPAERCDGEDNDGDTQVDENWPALGKPCGERAGVGECVAGEYVCSEDGAGVVCEGAVGPAAEVCDGKDNDCDGTPDNGPDETCDGEDNDCDGLVDEGVLSLKSTLWDDHASVAAVTDAFVVTRLVGERIRVETYDTLGNRSGHDDDMQSPSETSFLASDGAGQRALVALGRYSFFVLDVRVDSDLVPIITEVQALHEDWKQGMTLGVYDPPYHPRVLATPRRFLGYRDVTTFALNAIAEGSLLGLGDEPTVVPAVPVYRRFDAAGSFVVWEQGENLRGGWVLDDGSSLFDIDIARGTSPKVAIGQGGPGLLYFQDGTLRLSELGALSLQCLEGRACNREIDGGALHGEPTDPTALAYDGATDTWFLVAGTQAAVLGRAGGELVVKQAVALDSLGAAPNRAEVVISGGTAALMQATEDGNSALTFLGCF